VQVPHVWPVRDRGDVEEDKGEENEEVGQGKVDCLAPPRPILSST
jgi:hypothetical protein